LPPTPSATSTSSLTSSRVLGYLDDVIILPVAIFLIIKMIPGPLMAEFREEAQRRVAPTSRTAAVLIIAGRRTG
jgi:hypothetical protein